MFHVNEYAKQNTMTSIIGMILPECYDATNLLDFMNHVEDIKPTKKIMPLGIFWYNLALIKFPSLQYTEKDKNTGILSDLKGEITVGLEGRLGLNPISRKNLKDGMRLYSPIINYRPSDGEMWLVQYHNQGPQKTEKNNKSIFNLIHQPA